MTSLTPEQWLAFGRDKLAEQAFSRLLGAELAARVPLGLGTPSDVGSTVVYLASPAARWVTGQTIQVAGGLGAS